jgi:hypothetical protein
MLKICSKSTFVNFVCYKFQVMIQLKSCRFQKLFKKRRNGGPFRLLRDSSASLTSRGGLYAESLPTDHL